MKKKYKSLIKNIGIFTLGSFGSKIISFLLLPLYTSILSTSDYGTVDLLQSTAQLLMPILLLSIQDATLRFGMDNQYEKKDVLSTTINIILKSTLIFIIGIIFVSVSGIIKFSLIYWLFLFFSFFFNAFNNCFNVYFKAKNEAKVIVVSGIISTLITCLTNILCLVVFNMGINGYMIGIIAGLLFQFNYQFFIGKIYKDFHIRKYNNLSKPMIKYSFPLIANSLSWWVNNASDRYILLWISGMAVNGVYAISCKIPIILTTFQSIFYNAWSISAIAEFDSKDKDGFIGNNYTIYSLLSVAVCSIIMLFNVPIAMFLYSKDFFSAYKCVPFLLVGTIFNGISQFEGSLFAATKKTKEVTKTTIIGAVVNTICNFIFIYLFGAIGAALATMIGY